MSLQAYACGGTFLGGDLEAFSTSEHTSRRSEGNFSHLTGVTSLYHLGLKRGPTLTFGLSYSYHVLKSIHLFITKMSSV